MTDGKTYDTEGIRRTCEIAILTAVLTGGHGPLIEALDWLAQAPVLTGPDMTVDLAEAEFWAGLLEVQQAHLLLSFGAEEDALEALARAEQHFRQSQRNGRPKIDIPPKNDSHPIMNLGDEDAYLDDVDAQFVMLSITKGSVLDRLGRHAEARETFAEAKRLLALPHLANWRFGDAERKRLALATGEGPVARHRVTELRGLASTDRFFALQAEDVTSPEDDLMEIVADDSLWFARDALREGIEELYSAFHDLGLSKFETAGTLLRDHSQPARRELALDWALIEAFRGFALQALGRPAEAAAAFSEAEERLASPDLAEQSDLDLLRLWVTGEQGIVLLSLGRPAEALAMFDDVANRLSRPDMADRADLEGDRITNMIHRAGALEALGRHGEARACIAEAETALASPDLGIGAVLQRDRALLAALRDRSSTDGREG